MQLRKIERDYDTTSKTAALNLIDEGHRTGQLITGLLYIDESRKTIMDTTHVVPTPLALLPEEKTRPSRESLEAIMKEYM